MKVLFIGDGKHDVGVPDGPHPSDTPWKARGVVKILSKKVVPRIDDESLALTWQKLDRLRPEQQGKGRRTKGRAPKAPKLVLAARLAHRMYGCEAVIAVIDRDGDEVRVEGLPRVTQDPVPTVYAAAIESIEAWTLGACSALAAELGLAIDRLRAHYPGVDVETLYEGSGRLERRPKDLLMRLAGLAHQRDSAALREAVADATDLTELERACPSGFAAFAAALRRTFAA